MPGSYCVGKTLIASSEQRALVSYLASDKWPAFIKNVVPITDVLYEGIEWNSLKPIFFFL